MKSRSDVISGGTLEEIKSGFFKDIKVFSKSLGNKDYSLLAGSSIYDLGWIDTFRTFLYWLNNSETSVKNLIISSLVKINSACPHAIELYIKCLNDSSIKNIDLTGQRINSSEIIECLKDDCSDLFMLQNMDTLVEALNKAGASGSISISVNPNIDESVVVDNGFIADCFLSEFFEGYLGNFDFDNCQVFVVNGKILDVSEIHHILDHCYNTKQKAIIVSTGFSDDVNNTLFVNWQKGNTDIIPFIVEDAVASVNEVKDISTVCGVMPITKDSGNRLSSIDVNDYPTIKVSYNAGNRRLSIVPDSSQLFRINNLRSSIRSKMLSTDVDDIRNILSARMSKLSLRNVVLGIEADQSEKPIIEDKVNSFFSHISRCGNQGVINARSELYNDYHVKHLPARDAILTIRRAISDRQAIDNIKAIIRLENS